jgi:hypothetical protein
LGSSSGSMSATDVLRRADTRATMSMASPVGRVRPDVTA